MHNLWWETRETQPERLKAINIGTVTVAPLVSFMKCSSSWISSCRPPPEEAPLPKAVVIALSSTLFCNALAITVIFPFLGFMIRSFGVEETQIGKNAGYVASSYMIGQFLSSYAWGLASDRFGRRPVLLASLLLTTISISGFGFSRSILQAIVWRFVGGCVNGITGVSKAVLTEISDDTNSGRAFGYMGMMWGMGLIAGPAVGGWLAMPSSQYPSSFLDVPLFRRFPFLLPCMVVGVFMCIGTVLGFVFVQETLPPSKRKKVKKEDVEMQTLIREEEEEEEEEAYKVTFVQRVCATLGFSFLWKKRILVACGLYALIGTGYMMFDEGVNVWAMLQPEDDGLGLSSSSIGTIISVGGSVLLVLQMILYPPLERKYGALAVFRAGIIMFVLPCFLLPWLSSVHKVSLVWMGLIVVQIIRTLSGLLTFISVFVLIANSAPLNIVGSVNGFAASLCTIGRAVGPLSGGSLLSWSVGHKGNWPWFGGHFLFGVCAILFLCTYGVSLLLDYTINKRLEVVVELK